MQIGLIIDGEKVDNVAVLHSKNIPLPFVGLRRFFVPDERRMQYYEQRELSVTTLLNFLRYDVEDLGCPMRAYLDYNMQIYMHPSSLMSLVQGKMLHDSLIPEIDEMQKEMHVEGTIYGINIGGDVDFYDERKGIVYDLKTAKSLYMIPKIEHLAQLYLYSQLLLQNNKKVNYATLLYISHGEMSIMQYPFLYSDDAFAISSMRKSLTPRAKISVDVEPDISNNKDAVGNTLQYNYSTKQFEPTVAYWRCAYCPYRRYCPFAKKNMLEYLLKMYHKSIPKFAEAFVNRVKYAGVNEKDEFLYPEDELTDQLTEIFDLKVDYVIELIKKKREIIETKFKYMGGVRW